MFLVSTFCASLKKCSYISLNVFKRAQNVGIINIFNPSIYIKKITFFNSFELTFSLLKNALNFKYK